MSKKVCRNTVDISMEEIASKKARRSKVDFSTIKFTSKKVHGNNVDFLTIEITSNKVRGNNVVFSTIEITSKKVRGNNVDFSTIKIASKNYVEVTWKFVEIWSNITYPRNIHIEMTSIQRGVSIGLLYAMHEVFIKELLFEETCPALKNPWLWACTFQLNFSPKLSF